MTRFSSKWRIEFCHGRHDDPTHSSLTVPAESVADAIAKANKAGVWTEWIDSIERDY